MKHSLLFSCCSTAVLLCLSGSLLHSASAGPAASDLLAGAPWTLLSPVGSAQMSGTPAGAAQVLHVTVLKPASLYYQIQLTHDIAAALPAGTHLRYRFSARSATHSIFHAVVEKRTAPYTHLIDQQITLTPVYKQYTFVASIPAAYGPRGIAARLQVGQRAGTFDFKDLTVTR